MSKLDFGDQIFENYSIFIKEHKNDISTPSEAVELLSSDGAFRAYIDSLTEGLSTNVKKTIVAISEREREFLLEESMNLGPSANVIGYAVSYFPILTDIYSDPILSEVVTTYPVNKPVITIPKITITSTIKNSDGTIVVKKLPSTTDVVRPKEEDLTLIPGTNNILFNLSPGGKLNADNAFVNKRYFTITKIQVINSNNIPENIPCMIRPDTRGQINYVFDYNDPNNNTYTFTLIGNIDWDNGIVKFNNACINKSTPSAPIPPSLTINNITANVMFTPKATDIGRVMVGIKTSGFDINVDVKDTFQIQLDQEVIQDYSDIYNVDMLRTLSLAIKNQVMYNKEYDLAYYLRIYEPKFKEYGSYATYNVDNYVNKGGTGDFKPANILDVFKGIIPLISSVSRNISRVLNADPQYIVCGYKVATILESLQEYLVGFRDMGRGEGGFIRSNYDGYDFRKQKIFASRMLPQDKLYIIYRAPNDDLSRTSIADIIYKPLYMIEEIDQSQRKTYIKSRTAIELTSPESIGVIKITNYEKYLNQ